MRSHPVTECGCNKDEASVDTMKARLSQKIIRNTISGQFAYLCSMIIGFFITPYIVFKIGIEQYGLFVLIEVVISFLSLFDISGINTSFVKYIAEYNAKNDEKRLNQIVSLGFAYYTVFWLVVCVLALFFKPMILSLFKIPATLAPQASFVYMGMLVIALVQGSLAIFRSILIGMQRLDVANGVGFGGSILYGLSTFVVLALHYGLEGIVINSMALAVIRMTAQTILAFKTTKWLRFSVWNLNGEMFMRTLGFGVRLQIAIFSELATLHASKFILGHFLSLKFVGFYELGSKIVNVAKSFAVQLLPSLFPAASELNALSDQEGTRRLYYRGGKYVALVAFPSFLFVLGQARIMIALWMGRNDYDYSVMTIEFLCIGFLVNVITGVACSILRGMGKPQYEMRSSLIVVVMNISISTVLVIRMRFIGALIGTTVSILCGSFYLIGAFHRLTKLPFLCPDMMKAYGMPLLGAVAGCCALLFFDYFVSVSPTAWSLRMWALASLAMRGILFLGVYGGSLWAMKCFDRYDRDFFRRIFEVTRSMTFGRRAG